MTTIAYRDGVLAADSLAVLGDRVGGSVRKVERLESGMLLGGCGHFGEIAAFICWARTGRDGKCPIGPDSCGLVVDPDGSVSVFEGGPEGANSFSIDAPFFAHGTGGPIAVGAMAAGATAEQAVRIAAEYDIYTGGEIVVVCR